MNSFKSKLMVFYLISLNPQHTQAFNSVILFASVNVYAWYTGGKAFDTVK